MANNRMNKDQIKAAIVAKLQRQFGCDTTDATDDQLYQALAMTVRDGAPPPAASASASAPRSSTTSPPSSSWAARCTTTWCRS